MKQGVPSRLLLLTTAAVLAVVLAWTTGTPVWWPVWMGGLALVYVATSIGWSAVMSCRRTRPEDTLGWRVLRACILATLRPAMHTVVSTREIDGPDGAHRLFSHQIDPLFDAIEPKAVRLRAHAGLSDLPSFGNRLMVELAVFTAAAYRVLLDDGIPAGSARSLVADAGWIVYSRMLRLASWPHRLSSRDPATRLRRTIKALLRFPFDASGAPGYAVTTQADQTGILTHFTHCPPQCFVRNLIKHDDRGDLEAFRQSWCRYDWPGADLIAGDGRRGHYSRPRTLSDGDSVCDMCWRGDALRNDESGSARREANEQKGAKDE